MKKQLRRIWRDHAGAIIVCSAVLFMLLLLVLIAVGEVRMIRDCVETTGRDYYECRALVKRSSAPVIINPGRF